MNIKAIETEYKGYRFRSRLEFRWAFFLDEINVSWSYEEEGYKQDSVMYLPDFSIYHKNDVKSFLEIKPIRPNHKEIEKAQVLASGIKTVVGIMVGDPYNIYVNSLEDTESIMIDPNGDIYTIDFISCLYTVGVLTQGTKKSVFCESKENDGIFLELLPYVVICQKAAKKSRKIRYEDFTNG
jgi:hypothetical protein